jgi:hypothetical protein
MKIDKVVFSTSEAFSGCWNLNSKIYKTKLGIEPVCLFFGDRSKTDLSEEFGKVIDMPIISGIPLLIQITWSKFYWPAVLDQESTWLIGDIDLFPLQTYWYQEKIKDISDDAYVHLDCDGITQLSHCPSWAGQLTQQRLDALVDLGCGSNMPGHYHVAKGRIMRVALENHLSWKDELQKIVSDSQFHNSRAFRPDDPIDQHNLWCAEELRSTKALRRGIKSGLFEFHGLYIRNGIDKSTGDRVDRSTFGDRGGGNFDYGYDPVRLENQEYVDLHAARSPDPETPFKKWMPQTENILRISKML